MADRIPLTDKEMVDMLHKMATEVASRDKLLRDDLNQIADRLRDLTAKAEIRRHWCGHE